MNYNYYPFYNTQFVNNSTIDQINDNLGNKTSLIYKSQEILPSNHCNFGNLNNKLNKVYLNQILNNCNITISSYSHEKNNIRNNIDINTNSNSSESINIWSNNGGIQIVSLKKIIKLQSNYINILSKNLFLESEKIINLKTEILNINSDELKLEINKSLDLKSRFGDIKISSGSNNHNSIYLNSIKGKIILETFKNDINLNSAKNIIIDALDNNSYIHIGKNSRNVCNIELGNNNSKVIVNSDLLVKGDIVINDNSIKSIGTSISETNESLIYLAKNNNLGIKDIGIIGKNANNFVGILFDQLRNQFVLAEKINFNYNLGINNQNKYLKLGSLLIDELQINDNLYIDKNGDIIFNKLKNGCLTIDNQGNFNSKGNLNIFGDVNINDKFFFNSQTGNCQINGILTINDLNINNLYSYYVGENYYFKAISDSINQIENQLEFKHQIIYLTNQIYNEDISLKVPIDIYGQKSIIYGSLDINILEENYTVKDLLIKNLTINIDSDYYSAINIDCIGDLVIEFNNLKINIFNTITYLIEINFQKGILILNNLSINLNIFIQNLILIKSLSKLIINNCNFYNNNESDTLTILDQNCQIIIKNSYLEGNYLFNQNQCILMGNIIKENSKEWYNDYPDLKKFNTFIH